MRRMRRVGWAAFFVLPGVLSGCSGSATGPAGSTQGTPANVRTADPAALPEVADPTPPLDGGRLTVRIPAGWDMAPRSNKYLMRFVETRGETYPSIIITADDYSGTHRVTGSNVEAFASELASQYAAQESTARLAAAIEPIQVGRFVGITTQRRSLVETEYKKITVEQLLLETVADGRKYTIELRTRDGDSQRYSPYLLATAASIQFGGEGDDLAADDEPASLEPPSDEPAAASPAEPMADAQPAPAAAAEPAAVEPAPKPAAAPSAPKPVAKPEPKKETKSQFEIIDDEEL